MKIRHKFQILLQSDYNIRYFTWRPKYVLLLLVSLNRHKSAVQFKNIRPFEQPRRHKHYAQAPKCYVTRELPSCFKTGMIWQGIRKLTGMYCCKLLPFKYDFKVINIKTELLSRGGGGNGPQWVMTSSFTRFLDHIQRRTTFIRTSLDEWSALPDNSQQTNVHAPGGIRNQNLSRRAAAELRLGPRPLRPANLSFCLTINKNCFIRKGR
jgi:hypothetical protein